MAVEIVEQDIGGARVRRTFTNGDRHMKAGEQIGREALLALPRANRRALADAGYIEVYPRAPQAEPGERIVVGVGKDKYNVIEGRVINKTPLSRSEAEELARQ
jgi:hypothetical protein